MYVQSTIHMETLLQFQNTSVEYDSHKLCNLRSTKCAREVERCTKQTDFLKYKHLINYLITLSLKVIFAYFLFALSQQRSYLRGPANYW